MVGATPEQLASHARAIAKGFGVMLFETEGLSPDEGSAAPYLKGVVVHRIIDESTYAVAMHEIGHVAAPMGCIRRPGEERRIEALVAEEEAAWEWAKHYALEWTPAMQKVLDWGLKTYTDELNAPAVDPLRAILARIGGMVIMVGGPAPPVPGPPVTIESLSTFASKINWGGRKK